MGVCRRSCGAFDTILQHSLILTSIVLDTATSTQSTTASVYGIAHEIGLTTLSLFVPNALIPPQITPLGPGHGRPGRWIMSAQAQGQAGRGGHRRSGHP